MVVFGEWEIPSSQPYEGKMNQTSLWTLQRMTSVLRVSWQPIRYELSWLRSATHGDLRVTLIEFDFDSFMYGTGNESWTERDVRRGRIRGEEHRRLILGLLMFDESTAAQSVFPGFSNKVSAGLGKRLRKPGELVDPEWSIVIIGISVLERRRRDLTSSVHSFSMGRCSGGLGTVTFLPVVWSERERTIRGLCSFRGKWGAWNDLARGGLIKG